MTTRIQTHQAAMSIDIEDWFHSENLKGVIARDTWDEQDLRVERNTDRMLELMDTHSVKCTCFILGWVAEKCPDLIKRIADAGHEIASHGYGHELIYNLSHDEFREDVKRGIGIVEDLTGTKIRGYRAPSFSITDWAIDILQELGLSYDCSAFPALAHDRYGKLAGVDSGQPIVEIRDGFHEVCLSVLKLGIKGIPWAGGGYFRLIPYPIFKRGVKQILNANKPYVFYIHPWEIDPGHPRVDGLKRSSRFRHYNNLDRCDARFDDLLKSFTWRPVGELLLMKSSRTARNHPSARSSAISARNTDSSRTPSIWITDRASSR